MLDETQRSAAVRLGEWETDTSVAISLGVSLETIREWGNDPEFSAEVDRLRYEPVRAELENAFGKPEDL